MNKARAFFAVTSALLACGCVFAPHKSASFDPSIERALELLSKTASGKPLLRYAERRPIEIRYSPRLKEPWPKFDPQGNALLLPDNARGSDYVVALLLARGLASYKIYAERNLADMLIEVEELAALEQAHAATELEIHDEAEVEASPGGKYALDELCAYLSEGRGKLLEMTGRNALDSYPEYGRPLETLDGARAWLKKTHQALEDGTLPQLLYQHDLARVKRGTLTQSEASENLLQMRTTNSDGIWRGQREYYFNANKILSNMALFKERALLADDEWRKKNAGLMAQRLDKTRRCQSYH